MLTLARAYPLDRIVDAVLAARAEQSPWWFGDWCLYDGPGLGVGEFFIDANPDVDDDDVETPPPAVAELGLEYFLDGQMSASVILNFDHQGAPFDDLALLERAFQHYQERDTFLTLDPIPHLRTLSRIRNRIEEYPVISRAVLSPVLRHRVQRLLGSEAAESLIALHGRELSSDTRIDLSAWETWTDWAWADFLGPDAPYNTFAFSGGGDAWAVRNTDQNVVFLDTAEAVVDLQIGVETFLRIADLWGQYDDEPNDFLAFAAPLLPVAVEEWEWPYR